MLDIIFFSIIILLFLSLGCNRRHDPKEHSAAEESSQHCSDRQPLKCDDTTMPVEDATVATNGNSLPPATTRRRLSSNCEAVARPMPMQRGRARFIVLSPTSSARSSATRTSKGTSPDLGTQSPFSFSSTPTSQEVHPSSSPRLLPIPMITPPTLLAPQSPLPANLGAEAQEDCFEQTHWAASFVVRSENAKMANQDRANRDVSAPGPWDFDVTANDGPKAKQRNRRPMRSMRKAVARIRHQLAKLDDEEEGKEACEAAVELSPPSNAGFQPAVLPAVEHFSHSFAALQESELLPRVTGPYLLARQHGSRRQPARKRFGGMFGLHKERPIDRDARPGHHFGYSADHFPFVGQHSSVRRIVSWKRGWDLGGRKRECSAVFETEWDEMDGEHWAAYSGGRDAKRVRLT